MAGLHLVSSGEQIPRFIAIQEGPKQIRPAPQLAALKVNALRDGFIPSLDGARSFTFIAASGGLAAKAESAEANTARITAPLWAKANPRALPRKGAVQGVASSVAKSPWKNDPA